ncbi:MAG TPA: nickel insertion protein, partial [Syntrophorhabdales bacterium]|nr:nickel insertion protein [Syntrophorhabdales bacterium]
MKLLYLDPILGISGDMCIAALIDAGCPFSELSRLLGQLPLDLPAMTPEKKRKGAIEGTYLHIGKSSIHFSIGQMREMIEGLGVEQRV